ncbi:MAG: tetraacyldisaccharide 4'-kinase [Bacteroidales bacterium]|nr:tetraacyldisaccharide 4'-kinase [Bacteroidales bacterium]
MIRVLLAPFSWLYALVVWVRHLMFDMGILTQKPYHFPLISIGNLAMGGTGKTPHTEYLVRLLLDQKINAAILSRGYGRKTKGFLKADEQNCDANAIGDEPAQFFHEFSGDIKIAVDGNRREGIDILMNADDPPEVILLDDAMQHRYVKPGLSILLTDYRNLYVDDHMVPYGGLRDLKSASKRANIIVVTKTEQVLSPIIRRYLAKKLKPEPYQRVYFSYFKYGKLISVPSFRKKEWDKKYSVIILFTGIANPYPLKDHLRNYCSELITISFPDHHVFTEKDIELVRNKYDEQFTKKKLIITTEKDAMRLVNSPYLRVLEDLPLFYLPIEVKFHGEDEGAFNNQIINYVRKNKADS